MPILHEWLLYRLTAKYFVEFNDGAFGGALSGVTVTWSKRLLRTAGVTKSRREYGNSRGVAFGRGGIDGGGGTFGTRYISKVELSWKVVDNEAKLREVCFDYQTRN